MLFDEYVKMRNKRRKMIRVKVNKPYQRKREIVLNHYSNGIMQCRCCGENEYEFLCVDHIDNNGAEHRRNEPTASNLVTYLMNNNYPMGYQVLCYNCNMSKSKMGECIHKIVKHNEDILN